MATWAHERACELQPTQQPRRTPVTSERGPVSIRAADTPVGTDAEAVRAAAERAVAAAPGSARPAGRPSTRPCTPPPPSSATAPTSCWPPTPPTSPPLSRAAWRRACSTGCGWDPTGSPHRPSARRPRPHPRPPSQQFVRTLATGERVFERRVPVGVIGAVFEARPNVTIDVASQVLKARSAAVLRTGSAALGSRARSSTSFSRPRWPSTGSRKAPCSSCPPRARRGRGARRVARARPARRRPRQR